MNIIKVLSLIELKASQYRADYEKALDEGDRDEADLLFAAEKALIGMAADLRYTSVKYDSMNKAEEG